MTVYIVCFALSLIIIRCIEKKSYKNPSFIFWSFIALLIPCLVAGLRAESIGTDVSGYAIPMYNVAKNSSSFGNFLETSWYHVFTLKKISDMEIGFDLLVYISAKVFGSLQSLLFLIEAFTIVPLYVALIKKRKVFHVWMGMLTFYSMFYNVTLNILRQGISMSFILLGFCYLTENRKVKSIIMLVFAVLFHTSGLLGIVIAGMYIYLRGTNTSKKNVHNLTMTSKRKSVKDWEFYKLLVLLLITIGITVFYNILVIILNRIGLSFYARYLAAGTSFLPGQILLRLPLFAFIALEWKYFRDDPLSLFYLGIMFIELFLSQLSGNIAQTIRVSLFFKILFVLIVPTMYRYARGRYKHIVKIGIPAYLVAYWVYNFIIQGSGETYPYLFYFK